MKKSITLFMVFYFLSTHIFCYGQVDSISNWQEQVLNSINIEDFSDASYSRLIEMLSDLELKKQDSVYHKRIVQNIILRTDHCLNLRDFFSHNIRYKLQAGKNWSAGFTFSQDAEEKFSKQLPWVDSFNYYIKYKNTILGRYRLKLGSGLIINQQFSLGKSIDSDAFLHSGTSYSPHSSTDEYNYLQGVITKIDIRHFSFVPFASFKTIDAGIKNDTITSIATDGYHRTKNELQKKNAATVFNTGFRAAFHSSWYEIGTNILYTRFPLPYHRASRAYNIYYYRGQQLLQGSVDYHIRRYGFAFRGETALDQNLNIASISQLSHPIGEDWTASLMYRYFSQTYQCLYAATVSESSSMQGEQGVLLNISGSPFPHWKVAFLFDYFSFKNIQYGYDHPFNGFDIRTQILYSKRAWNINISYRLKSKESLRHNADAVISYKVLDGLSLKSQLRGKIFSPKDIGGFSLGYSISEALNWNKEDCPFSGEIQATWFEAEDYDSRLYISEKNILYGFNIPMLYGRGMRGSATCVYKIRPSITLDLKYSLFHYLDRDQINCGLQKINGHDQYNISLQLRLKI